MMYFDRSGQAMSLDEWSKAFEEERHIGDDTIGGQRVSTVWLGINHNWGSGPTLIFETMIFGGPHDKYCERFATEEGARQGHWRIVQALRQGVDPNEGGDDGDN